MHSIRLILLASLCGLGGGTALAQQWELGGTAGFGVLKNLTATNAAGSATTGFKSGAGFGAFAGQDLYERLGGEFRYLYRFSDLKLSSGGTDVTFNGISHMVHYDLLFYGAGRRASVRPFVAAGGGVRQYRGTGTETAFQPLDTFALLTKTSETKGLFDFGAGFKAALGSRTFLRVEVRDYVTPTPKAVLAPAPNAKISGWVHDFMPMVSLSVAF